MERAFSFLLNNSEKLFHLCPVMEWHVHKNKANPQLAFFTIALTLDQCISDTHCFVCTRRFRWRQVAATSVLQKISSSFYELKRKKTLDVALPWRHGQPDH